MAVTFANDTTIRTSTLVADFPENILIDAELTGRIDTTDIESLIADIIANGQRTPVVVRKNEEGQPVLVFGHRRHRAVTEINKRRARKGAEPIKLECKYEKLDEEQAFAAAIAENRFRKDATPMDDSHNINVWLNRFKKPIDEIAAVYFPEAKKPEEKAAAAKWVKDRAALVELAPEAAQAVRDGKVKITAAVQLTRLSRDQQRDVIKQAANTVKGKERIKVAAVLATKSGKTADKAKAALAASTAKKSGSPASVPAKPVMPAVKPTSTIYEAAEMLALAVDAWLRDEPKADKGIMVAHKAYRALVPLRKAEGEAAA